MKYKVFSWSKDKKPSAWSVSEDRAFDEDAKLDEELIVFNIRHPSEHEEQHRRASEYRDFINMQEEAKAGAVKNLTITTAVAKKLSQP